MQKIRYGIIVLGMLLCLETSASAQVSIGIGLPNVSIGINLPLFPHLVPVPGYPVYYAPRVDANYFFYDGLYWVYQNDNWYASSWYNGPWGLVNPQVVPLFILRIPVRYYRQPPSYFYGWPSNAPPRWGQHWGPQWEQHRGGWDRWNRGSAPRPAPLPVYQRQYSGDRYPDRMEQQQNLHREKYRYQPRDTTVRQHYQQQGIQRAPAPAQRGKQQEPPMRSPSPQTAPRSTPYQQGVPAGTPAQSPHQTPPQQRGPAAQPAQPAHQTPPQQRGPAVHEQKQQPGAAQQQQQAPGSQGQDKGKSQEHKQGHGQEQKKDGQQGRERNN